MKMSDYFFNGSVDCDDEGCLIENGFKIARGICKYKAVAISHAVSNHDRLTEENAKLREFLESLQLDVSNEIKLEQLLNQLNDQNNDNS